MADTKKQATTEEMLEKLDKLPMEYLTVGENRLLEKLHNTLFGPDNVSQDMVNELRRIYYRRYRAMIHPRHPMQ